MGLREGFGKFLKKSANRVETAIEMSANAASEISAGNACSRVKNTTRVVLMVAIPSLFNSHPARGQDKMDASVENGESMMAGSLELMNGGFGDSADTENMTGCPPDEPTPDGRSKIQGSCVFTVPGENGTRFKMELQDAVALMDTDMNVELKVGGIRGIEGVENPPRITVCGTNHCMDANIDNVGWVLRTSNNEVQVKSELGDILVTTTFNVEETVKEGEWVNISLENPDNSAMPTNCSIRWSKESSGSDYLLSVMASLLYLELMKRRRKNRK